MDETSNTKCGHSVIEHLGTDADARFSRCRGCGRVFVFQGGRTWAIDGLAQSQGGLAPNAKVVGR
jgi:hypothetical protein